MKCLGKNNKGKLCNYKPLQNDNYCKLHQSYKKFIELSIENKICTNWIRGCWNSCTSEWKKCLECRLNEREKDKLNRNTKKEKASQFNCTNNSLMCNVCNKIVDNLKNNKCEKCYLIGYNSNKSRNDRDIYFSKLYEYKSGAKKRNINFELSDDKCFELFKEKCYYCGELDQVNGIDRINSNNNYTNDNCVSCCKQCNFMKNKTDQPKFLQLCEHISTFNRLYDGKLYTNILKNTKFGKYTEYILSAEKRNINFELLKDEFIDLISKPCNYCGVSDLTFYKTNGAGGIDRVDSNKGYNLNNCLPCCGMCNQMKLDYTKKDFLNQCLKIIKNQKNLINKTNCELKLIENFYKLQNLNKSIKKKFVHSKEYYHNKIWNGTLEDLKKIKLKLITVNDSGLFDIWNYYKHSVSSLKLTENSHLVGRQLYILVSDEITDKYLGILSLSSDYLYLEDRDDFIGWTKQNKIEQSKLNYIMNISTCVPLQPFGFNFTGGKLLTKLVFSEEVQTIFREKYKTPLLAITTTSLYGKSIQYDRLKEIKLIGYTKGNSVYKYPTDFIKECKKYLFDYYNINLNRKLYIISRVLEKLELPKDEFMRSNPKGIYFGFIYSDSKDFLCEKTKTIKDTKLNSINEIFNEWLDRWAIQRFNNLNNNNKLMEYTKYSSNERTKKYIENIKIKIGDEEHKRLNREKIKCYREKKKLLKNPGTILNDKLPNIKIIEDNTSETLLKIENTHINNITDTTLKTYNVKPDLPDNLSLYKEKDVWYLSFNKKINTIRYNKKIKLKCMCIQTELNRLIDIINTEYPNLNIPKYIIQNSYDFTDKTPLKENIKPNMPENFSICNINGIDYIQFSKKINDKKIQYKTSIKTYDLQDELNRFIKYLNNNYNLGIDDNLIINNSNGWVTTNNIRKTKNNLI